MLTASGDYRVLRRFSPRARYGDPPPGATTRWGLYVDVETTGLDTATAEIIEFAAVPFEYDVHTGRVFAVGNPYAGFEEPHAEIPADVVALTGITPEMVRGHRLDDAAIEALSDLAGVVIAHNAAFDRKIVERRLPCFAGKAWACSHAEVPWHEHGCRGSKLDYILFQRCAEYFGGHRATDDCRVGIHVLATLLPDGTPPLRLLLESARRPTIRIWATGSPIAVKDQLKARRYRFRPRDADRDAVWYLDCRPDDVEAELAWLDQIAYGRRGSGWELTELTAVDRYSSRC